MFSAMRALQILLVTLCACLLVGCPPPNALHSLTLAVTPAGSGEVRATPDRTVYFAGTEVTLEAIPNEGYAFSRWLGAGINTTLPVTEVAVYSDQIVTAVFKRQPEGDVEITSDTVLPGAEVGLAYEYAFTATGGAPPYTWVYTSGRGTRPPGLDLTSGGTLSGTPTTQGVYTFRVRATDGEGGQDEKTFSLTVNSEGQGQLDITTDTALPDGEVGTTYQLDFAASGGAFPYSWELVSAVTTLPTGLALTSGGTLQGLPVLEGVYTFQVRATDASGASTERFFVLTILSAGNGEDNVVQDPGFEGGPATTLWTQTSASFDSVICDVDQCGTINDVGAHSGAYWVFFGGTPNGEAETAAVAQQVVMPFAGTGTLQFYLAIPSAEAPCGLEVSIADTVLFEVTEADQAAYSTYQLVTLDASPFVDGGTYMLRFDYYSEESPATTTAVFVDDVLLVGIAGD